MNEVERIRHRTLLKLKGARGDARLAARRHRGVGVAHGCDVLKVRETLMCIASARS